MASTTDAFTASSTSWDSRTVKNCQQTQLRMFAADDVNDAPATTPTTNAVDSVKPLATIDSTVSSEQGDKKYVTSTPVERPAMLARNLNTGEIKEVKWVDPAMQANTNPFQMDWWAYPLIGLPFILLANDALHFIPEDGPLSYLLRF